MFGSAILDVAIGMAVVYLILSLIASVIQEGIAAVLQSRPANLLRGLHSLFSGDVGPKGQLLLTSLYDHGLIRGLYRDPVKDSEQDPKKDAGQDTKNIPDTKKGLRTFDRIRMKMQEKLGLGPPPAARDAITNRMLLPAYIPSRTFALALIDILDPAESGAETSLDQLRASLAAALKNDKENKALQALSALADGAGKDLAEFQARIEDWYNDAMDRVSGWYKKYTQNILLAVGLVLAIAFNVNSIRVASRLWTDKDAREAMVTMASQQIQAGPPESAQGAAKTANTTAAVSDKNAGTAAGAQDNQTADAAKEKALIEKLSRRIDAIQDIEGKQLLPIGWSGNQFGPKDDFWAIIGTSILMFIGWVITALALSLGAAFWFDTLNKFMIIRGTIKPDEKSQPEESKG